MMSDTLAPVAPRSVSLAAKLRQYYALTKPRVVQLIVFCALIGMLLATPGLPDWQLALAGVAGIWLVAAAAAAFNCLVEQRIDSRMARPAARSSGSRSIP
jgi:protoheme IX farnesyltransferase